MSGRDPSLRFITKCPAGYWVRISVPGAAHNGYAAAYFAALKYGGDQAALEEAKRYRDKWVPLLGADTPRVRAKRSNVQPKNQDLISGLQEITTTKRKNGSEFNYHAICATHPRKREERRFSFVDTPKKSNQRTRREAIRLAEKVRRDWEREEGLMPSDHVHVKFR